MFPPERDTKGCFEDLLEGCERIARYTAAASHESFLADSLLQDAVVWNLEVTAEASRQLQELQPDIENRFSSIPFKTMYTLCNHLVDDYASVDTEAAWAAAKQEIPSLRPLLIETLRHWPAGLS